ncbi:MAG: hypothetical protein HYZ16_09590 [Bacteroidetes bacterium]|jgi:hypothetical protein|nr:hypothetical protein [Bacteroidota bacterium]
MRGGLFLVLWVGLLLWSPKAQCQKQYFFELSPLYFFYQGGGGAIGAEKGHWQNGFSFTTFNPSSFVQGGKVHVTGSYQALRAMNFEPFTKFFFSKERKWVYLGLHLVPEIYQVLDQSTGTTNYQINLYAKPKAGIRWFPFKEVLYLDLGYAVSVRLLDAPLDHVNGSTLQWNDYVGYPEASIGLRIK